MSSISRRDFLKRAAFVSASSYMLSWPGHLSRRQSERVLVVGAGLAGLAAAYELDRLGYDVLVLEAQQRPGGRVLTLRAPFADKGQLYVEAGAAYFPDNHEHVMRYARSFGLPLRRVASSRGVGLAYLRGRRLKFTDVAIDPSLMPYTFNREEQTVGLFGIFMHYFWPLQAHLKDLGQQSFFSSYGHLDDISLAEHLRKQGASDDAIKLISLGSFYSELDQVSALWGIKQFMMGTSAAYQEVAGGNDQLPAAFAAALKSRIRYGMAVRAVRHGPAGVEVIARSAARGQQEEKFSAERVVLAIPAPLLDKLQIEPPLSPEKQRALRELTSADVFSAFLCCRRRFWEEEGLSGTVFTDLPLQHLYHATVNQAGPRGVLAAEASGVRAAFFGNLPRGERLSAVIEQAAKFFPQIAAEVEIGETIHWGENEWARGAFSVFGPGQLKRLLPLLARPEGRLHFAGEYTSWWNGWAEGALESGERAAREVAAAANRENT